MNINIISPINQLGYGIAGGNIVRALVYKDNPVCLWPIGQPDWPERQDTTPLQFAVDKAERVDFEAPCVRIWHQHDMSQFVGRGTRIGFPIFELNKFTDVEKKNLAFPDKIFVCSKWAKEVVEQEVQRSEVHVVPLGVDSDVFFPSTGERKETIFFTCGKWEVRKSHDIIAEAFSRAFEPSDDVELWMMCSNPFLNTEQNYDWERTVKTSKMGGRVRIIPKQRDQYAVADIMRMSDCGVFPAKAEGWNLELLEMMACGKHVIATNYSGHTEFCDEDNCLLVDIDTLEDAQDGVWFNGEGEWAHIGEKQIDMVAQYMRDIHILKQSGSLEDNSAGLETAEKFSWYNTAEVLLDAVST